MNKLEDGDLRIVKKFVWFPQLICGKFYWLKTVYITEKYAEKAFVDVSNYTDEIEDFLDGWIPISVNQKSS